MSFSSTFSWKCHFEKWRKTDRKKSRAGYGQHFVTLSDKRLTREILNPKKNLEKKIRLLRILDNVVKVFFFFQHIFGFCSLSSQRE